ncbi:MAG TPA: acetyl-CoA carboxylase biotin carboxylase subunit, partial [Gemmatimonadales bacterium]
LPSTGRISYLRAPGGPGVRWDAGFEAGDEVSLFYDSMIAKLIVFAPDRITAIARMRRALNELVVLGVATNQGFHTRLFADPSFRAGEVDIQFLERRADLLRPVADEARDLPLAVAAALLEDRRRHGLKLSVGPGESGPNPWLDAGRRDGLR